MNENKVDSEQLLLSHGVKPTANRIMIVCALSKVENPVTLSDLEALIGTIDKSSIFRALQVFKTCHLVHVLEDGGDGVRYELCRSKHCCAGAGGDDDVHVHFYCEHCRKTFCFPEMPVPAVALPEGYLIYGVNYMVKGICPQCRLSKKKLHNE